MKSKAYQTYYEKNREDLTAKMRSRDAMKREERRKYLLENPEEIDFEREKMRDRYHNWVHNTIKRKIDEALVSRPDMKVVLEAYLKDDLYKTMKPSFCEWLDSIMRIKTEGNIPTV